jgi:hypothetical protein
MFSNLQVLYNGFFFNVFIITPAENNENVKYNRKNNIVLVAEVFLAIRNHESARNSSARNFTLTATRVNMACSFASRSKPLKKITTAAAEITVNAASSMIRSDNRKLIPVSGLKTIAARMTPAEVRRRRTRYLI